MKTKILPIILLFLVISGLSQSSHAATITHANYTVLNDIKDFNKIEVRGNVELFISDGSTDKVNVYNKYYSESALIQCRNGVLRISSYTAEKLIVWVTADDLRSVSAYDNAEVKSFGDLSKIEFSVDLHNDASAKLNLNAYSTDVTLRDHSKIELSGTATEFSINHNAGSTVINRNFSANHYAENKTITATEAKSDELVGLE